MNRLISFISSMSSRFLMILCVFLTLLLGLLDMLTSVEFSFSIFYLIPISLVTWFVGKRSGILISVIGSIDLLIDKLYGGQRYTHPLAPYWNDLTELTMFLVITFTLSALKGELRRQNTLALTDALTGVANKRAFLSLAEMELDRARRYDHSLTLAYIDLDNFKQVNDRYGHHTGDELLVIITGTIKQHIRASDVVARLGGDEFAILIPEVNPQSARTALQKVQDELLKTMQRNSWPVTFSIGAITLSGAHCPLDKLLIEANMLMYSVKKAGKNNIAFKVITADSANAA